MVGSHVLPSGGQTILASPVPVPQSASLTHVPALALGAVAHYSPVAHPESALVESHFGLVLAHVA